MAGKRPDFSVFVSRKSGDKTFYTRIGSAWHVGENGISIRLDALPVSGECVMFPPKDDE